MIYKRLAVTLGSILVASLVLPAGAEISNSASTASATPEAAYIQYLGAIHKATVPSQLPAFSHSSPINKIKLADTPEQEKEFLAALKEMTPHTVKEEGKVEFGDRTYLFFEGDPNSAANLKEYFPVTAEMVKEEGQWKLRRQQSAHVKEGSPEAEVIPKGQARIKRFQDLLGALSRPCPNQAVSGTIAGKPFRPKSVYFMSRDQYFKLIFVDGDRGFSVYVRDPSTFGELQRQHFSVNPLDGMECDLAPEEIVMAPYAGKLEFGTISHNALPGTISLSVRTPLSVNLQGVFFAQEDEDAFSPDKDEQKAKKGRRKSE